MSLLSKLFGGKSEKSTSKAETYKDFTIFVEPIKESSGYRVAARIEKEIGGEVKVHQMVRADVANALSEAQDVTLIKAKTFIDQMGDGIFD